MNGIFGSMHFFRSQILMKQNLSIWFTDHSTLLCAEKRNKDNFTNVTKDSKLELTLIDLSSTFGSVEVHQT